MADPIFKGMAGKAVPEGMRRYPFRQAQLPGMVPNEHFNGIRCQWGIPYGAGEQPSPWTAIPVPVLRKDLEIAVTEDGIPVLPVLR